ncbi:hypothetical protein [Neptuniibacter sp. QD57_21]|uniref:hypothetical protein n=1 Tax=Neptuniibacter sp. QD57_21 TaxID=3398213 RepID=UPI0039F60AB4
MDDKVLAVIVGALLGSGLSAIGFLLKSRKETKVKLNESLFHLLEIWSVFVFVKAIGSDSFHKKLVKSVKNNFPNERLTKNDELELKKGMIMALPALTGSDLGVSSSLMEKYCSSVAELSKVDPILAFELKSKEYLVNAIQSMDKIVGEEMDTTSSYYLLFKNNMIKEVLSDFESDLKSLSAKSGFIKGIKTRCRIKRMSRRVSRINDDQLDSLVINLFGPLIQAHYDELGIDNPNVKNINDDQVA